MRQVGLGMLLMLAVLSVAQAQSELPGEIRLASEVWEAYTEADGTGLGWDVMREVFEPAGVRLDIYSVPYTRAVGLVQRGEADAWLGSYRDEVEEQVLYPTYHYDRDQIVALGLKDTPVPTLDSLGAFRLVWVRGYGYEEYLPNVRDYREVQRRVGILGMLDQGRTDFYLDAQDEVTFILRDARVPSRYRVYPLTELPLYLGFGDNPRGRALANLFDKRMDMLVADGSLRPIFQRWKQSYPFD